MRIIEVRDGLIKIESAEKLLPSSFLKISDSDMTYIAQILRVRNAGSVNNIYAKPIALYNGAVYDYDGTMPSNRSGVDTFDFESVNMSFDLTDLIYPFNFIDNSPVKLDKTFLESLLISSDNPKTAKILTDNIFKQIKKVLFIDMQGNFEAEKYFGAKDFNLPLNKDTLAFLYEDCLNDATSESKILIKELFRDLAEYSNTVSFLPFESLKTVVDNMVEKEHEFKLLVLKNKLAKFKNLGYFAGNQSEVDRIKEILNSDKAVIDLSKLDSIFQNRYLEYIYSAAEKCQTKPLIFVNISNSVNKKNLKNIILNPELKSVVIASPRFKYINEIKPMFKNFIAEPSFVNNENFRTFAELLTSAPKNCALFVGNASKRLPLIFNIAEVEIEAAVQEKDVNESASENSEISTEDAILQKSEQLMEQLSEENTAPGSTENLFDNDEEEVNIVESDLDYEPEQQTDDDKTFGDDSEEEFFDDEPEISAETEENAENSENTAISFSDESAFHTSIDDTKTVEVPAEDAALDELNETSDEDDDFEELDNISVSEEIVSDFEDTDVLQENIDSAEITEPDEIIEPDEQITSAENEIVSEDVSPEESEITDDNENLSENNDDNDFDAIVELDEGEISDADIVVDLSEDDLSEEETLDKEITQDVDKVFNTVKDETISDDDLDLIDQLNNELDDTEVIELSEDNTRLEDTEELPEIQELEENPEFLEPLEEVSDSAPEPPQETEILETKSNSTPIVPVYDAEIPEEDRVMSDPIEQGDTVVHAKYGTGIVEKMIKYGNKNLYSINFDNVGRRLLDPTLTELKKA